VSFKDPVFAIPHDEEFGIRKKMFTKFPWRKLDVQWANRTWYDAS